MMKDRLSIGLSGGEFGKVGRTLLFSLLFFSSPPYIYTFYFFFHNCSRELMEQLRIEKGPDLCTN